MTTSTERRRKSVYTDKLAERVCQAIATSTVGIKRMVAADKTLPSESTIYLWVQEYPEFADNYHAAREAQAEARWEMCQETAETCQKQVQALVDADSPQLAAKTKALNDAAKLVIEVQYRLIAWLVPKKAQAASGRGMKKPEHKGGPFVLPDDLSDLIC